ncbi:MAG: hypothetical protein AAF998_27355, partial [Bacteroidota bacterium]
LITHLFGGRYLQNQTFNTMTNATTTPAANPSPPGTSIVFWNIEKFGQKKFSKKIIGAHRMKYFLSVIKAAQPQIISIVEVQTDKEKEPDGTLIQNEGLKGALITLIDEIRKETGNQHWMLVPPLRIGSGGLRESVAVIYDSSKLYFTGPNVWTSPMNPAMVKKSRSFPINQVPAGSDIAAYSDKLNPYFSNRTIPSHAKYNAGRMENKVAGRYRYKQVSKTDPLQLEDLFFPYGTPQAIPSSSSETQPQKKARLSKDINPPRSRTPFLATFCPVNPPADGSPAKNIKLYTVHTTPGDTAQDSKARRAVQNLAKINDLEPANNEVTVIAGDFNVNIGQKNGGPYLGLLRQGYSPGIHAFNVVPQEAFVDVSHPDVYPEAAKRPYTLTMMMSRREGSEIESGANFFNTSVPSDQGPDKTEGYTLQVPQDSPGGPYPAFGYLGKWSGLPATPSEQKRANVIYRGSYDNFFVKYGADFAGAQDTAATVMNPIVGSPYQNVSGLSHNAALDPFYLGTLPYARQIDHDVPVPDGVSRAGSLFTDEYFAKILLLAILLGDSNYEIYRGTSDHLPIHIQV